jgi:hypothetical protein
MNLGLGQLFSYPRAKTKEDSCMMMMMMMMMMMREREYVYMCVRPRCVVDQRNMADIPARLESARPSRVSMYEMAASSLLPSCDSHLIPT